MSKDYRFDVSHGGDDGLLPYSEEVTITLLSGDPGGEPGEFEQHMQQALREWFDGARVELATAAARYEPAE